jgi:hypothetical protein
MKVSTLQVPMEKQEEDEKINNQYRIMKQKKHYRESNT